MNTLDKYVAKKKLAHALMDKIAQDAVVTTPRPGVTDINFKRGMTFYGGKPPAKIQKARDMAKKITSAVSSSAPFKTVPVVPKKRTLPTINPSTPASSLKASYVSK